MKRLFALPGIPTLEQLSYAIFTQLDRLISLGGMVPLAVCALLAYALLIGRQRVTPA